MECNNPITVAAAYSFTLNGAGVFADLEKLSPPWAGAIKVTALDNKYYLNHSGQKPFALSEYINENGALSEETRTAIAEMLIEICGKRWQKLYDTLSFDYNPINNYDMTEEGEDTDTHSGKDTSTRTPNIKNIDDFGGDIDATTDNKRWGFNDGDEARPTDSIHTHTVTKNTDTISTTGEDKTELDHGEVIATKHKLTRSGNIGVTTSQQMIQSERDLWLWKFFDVVFADVDETIALPIYN